MTTAASTGPQSTATLSSIVVCLGGGTGFFRGPRGPALRPLLQGVFMESAIRFGLAVRAQNVYLHQLPHLDHHVRGLLDVPGSASSLMCTEAILMDADVHEGPELRYIRHHALERHAGL